VAVVKLLLDKGRVDPNAKDHQGQTPLLYAAQFGTRSIVDLLFATGKIDPEIDIQSIYAQCVSLANDAFAVDL
jgi:ankyrin repeat protein